ncbi:MAG: CoA transferase [Chloroflexi bacterium]|nr:CoA transferase [Chloroflexota bacterium]
MPGALDGVVVLDLAQMWAVPLAGAYLADQGADVIKVEPPWGDEARRTIATATLHGQNRHYLAVNRNKRGIAADLRHPEGVAVIRRLVQRADVLLQNFRPGVAERLGLGYDDLRQLNSRLIYVASTPYGQRGPYAARRAYDLLVQAHAGLLSLRRAPDGMPLTSGVWIADMSAPMLIAYGVALALLDRARTGRGQKVETALLYAAVAMQAVDLVRGEDEREPPRSFAAQAMYAPYRCSDDRFLILVVVSDAEWRALCRSLEVEHLTAEPRYATSALRAEHSAELFGLLQGIFETRPLAAWLERLMALDVPCAPVLARDEVFDHPQLVDNEMIVGLDQPGLGRVRLPGVPVRLSAQPPAARGPAPGLGEHTDEVLREFGFAPAEVAALRARGAVA